MNAVLSKFIGSLVGTAVGDSLGAGREGSGGFEEVKEIGPRYTDDTAMMIGVAESLVERRGFDPANMVERFIANFAREPWRGYGWGPPRIFRLIQSGRRWEEMLDREFYPGGSLGNGAAMRAAPIGLFYYDDPEKLREAAYESSKITHSNEMAMEGTALQAYAVALAVKIAAPDFDKRGFLAELKKFVRLHPYQEKLDRIRELMGKSAGKAEVVMQLGNGIEALNSVPTAVHSFLSSQNFESSVVYAVSLGGDADTIGAMTGAIAGACYGVEGIPRRWKEEVENGKDIERLAERLWNIKKKT